MIDFDENHLGHLINIINDRSIYFIEGFCNICKIHINYVLPTNLYCLDFRYEFIFRYQNDIHWALNVPICKEVQIKNLLE